jgi:DNA-binding LacI/PurR family transcriptional regulator
MKELCVRYGISFRPLKKALAALVENNLLEPRGVRYAVPGVGAARSGTSIVCVCFASRDKNRTVLGSVDKEFLGILERECAHAGVGLSIVLVCHENDGFVFVNQKDRAPWDPSASEGQTAGFIVLVNVRRHFEPRVIHFLAARKKPCAVFDQVGIAHPKTVAALHRFMRIFTISSGMKPGRTVARYLLLKGHTKAAFFSPFHRADWSINRLKGLQRFFREAHPDTDILPFVFEQAGSTEDFVDRALRGMDTDNLHAWCAATAAAFRADTGIACDPAGDLYSAMFRGCASVEVAEALRPLFVRALTRSGVTLWVMVNDTTALKALDFLTEEGVRVPRDISLVSFDNTPAALENGLTSFDFNVGTAVGRILAFLLYPLDFTSRHARPVVEIEGMIIERNSTRGSGGAGTSS